MKYIALFKGINVGGKNIVKMADLRAMLAELGFQNITTYIQSGNAVFESTLSEQEVKKRIDEAFTRQFDFLSRSVVRSLEAWQDVIKNMPFTKEEIDTASKNEPEIAHLYLFFASEDGQFDDIAESDRLRKYGRYLYLLTDEGIRVSKAAAILMRKEGVTSRNWKTVLKMAEIAAR